MTEQGSPQKLEDMTLREVMMVHIAGDKSRDEKIDKMYEILVIGNGHEPLQRTVARHSDWIGGVNKVIWAISLAIITLVITTLGSFAYLIIRIYPLLLHLQSLEQLK
jgi:hypothetical protein